jgi:ribonuclease T2
MLGHIVHRYFAACAAALAIAGFACGSAIAQKVPYRERPNVYDRGSSGAEKEHRPGNFDYYVLVLSWSPSYCAEVGDRRKDPQCRPREGRHYSFVLHGLWPQFERGWPQNCRSADRGYVPRPVANRMLDIMPSDKLVFHEYRTHGTCTGLGVDGYFDLARRLYEKIKIPKRFVGLTDDRLMVGPGELMRDFVANNPGLKPDMLAVHCGGPGNRLKEVRVCFDRSGNFRSCGRNEDQGKLCSADHMYVPPVRSGAPREQRPPGSQRDILPGPRGDRQL